jgi:hypothetical protein
MDATVRTRWSREMIVADGVVGGIFGSFSEIYDLALVLQNLNF